MDIEIKENLEETQKRYDITHQHYIESMQNFAEFMTKIIKNAIKKEEYPRYLYRYRKMDDLKEIISDNKLHFSSPANFTDPYDSKLKVKIEVLSEEIRATLNKLNFKNRTEEEIESDTKKIADDPLGFAETLTKIMKRDINETRICCFSRTWKNLQMWDLYSEGHKGAVLKFDILKDPYFFAIPIIMRYSNKFPVIEFGKETTGSYINTKHKNYSFEEEIRVIKIFAFVDNMSHYEFKKDALVSVVFGSQSDDLKSKSIVELAKAQGYPNLHFRKAKLMENEYGLDIENYV
ncbi:MAG TPA: hypothetical protein VK806_07175 [Bacteroidia bacterium]|jgi:hypothetical protein|nr:hypothetical protein [Bacteroidia bacterium]